MKKDGPFLLFWLQAAKLGELSFIVMTNTCLQANEPPSPGADGLTDGDTEGFSEGGVEEDVSSG